MSQPQGTKITFDHKVIKQWAEERKGKPVKVKVNTENDAVESLKIKLPGEKVKNVIPVTWEEFFKDFDTEHMAFQFRDETPEGSKSRFYKLFYR